MVSQDLDGQGAWHREDGGAGVDITMACDDEHARTVAEEIKLHYTRTTIAASNDRCWSSCASTKARSMRPWSTIVITLFYCLFSSESESPQAQKCRHGACFRGVDV